MSGATDNKYDRQLRLWGANGQKALMSSNVLLINPQENCRAVGSETLKNLCLPGLGKFTIMDSFAVGPKDLG
jgi:amyloid beta precursor protein binding protein 1